MIFSDLGTVEAAGDTKEASNYQYIHQYPSSGSHYYRLKIIDQDNTFEYSPIVYQNIEQKETAVTIFPNPSINGNFNIKVDIGNNIAINTVYVIDSIGELVYQENSNTDWVRVELDDLGAGLYTIILDMNDDRETIRRKIIIQ